MNLYKHNIIMLLALTIVIASSGISFGAEKWQLAGFSKYRDGIFVNISRLSFSGADTAQVWVKVAPWEKSKYRDEILAYLEHLGKGNRGFKSIELLCEVDCAKNWIRFSKYVYLDKGNDIIHEVDDPGAGWLIIQPGSIWSNVQNLSCKARR